MLSAEFLPKVLRVKGKGYNAKDNNSDMEIFIFLLTGGATFKGKNLFPLDFFFFF